MKSSLDTDYSTVVKLFGFLSLLACFLLAFQLPSPACTLSRPDDDVSGLPDCSRSESTLCSENKEWCLKSKTCLIQAKSRKNLELYRTIKIRQTFESLYRLESASSLFPKYALYRSESRHERLDQGGSYWLSNDGWVVGYDGYLLKIRNPQGEVTAKISAKDFAGHSVASDLTLTYCEESSNWLAPGFYRDEVYFWGPFLIVRVEELLDDFISGCPFYREIVIDRQTGKILVNWQTARLKNNCENPLTLAEALGRNLPWDPASFINGLLVVPNLIRTAQVSWHHFRTGQTIAQEDDLVWAYKRPVFTIVRPTLVD